MKKRPDGRYKVSLTIDGKRHYFYGRTIKEAEQQRNKYKNTLHSAPNRRWRRIHTNHTYINYVNMCYRLWLKLS